MSTTTCKHCQRDIQLIDGTWVDPQATGDDSLWRETCDANHTDRAAQHEPTETRSPTTVTTSQTKRTNLTPDDAQIHVVRTLTMRVRDLAYLHDLVPNEYPVTLLDTFGDGPPVWREVMDVWVHSEDLEEYTGIKIDTALQDEHPDDTDFRKALRTLAEQDDLVAAVRLLDRKGSDNGLINDLMRIVSTVEPLQVQVVVPEPIQLARVGLSTRG
jgi:hypothetical protein